MAQFSIQKIVYRSTFRGMPLPVAEMQLSDGTIEAFAPDAKRHLLAQGFVNITGPPEPLPPVEVETIDGAKTMISNQLPDELAADALMVFVDSVDGSIAPLQDGQVLLERK